MCRNLLSKTGSDARSAEIPTRQDSLERTWNAPRNLLFVNFSPPFLETVPGQVGGSQNRCRSCCPKLRRNRVEPRERVRRALFPPFCLFVHNRYRFSRLTKRLIDVHQTSSISASVCMRLFACPCTSVHTWHITICRASARICSSLSEHLCAHECCPCQSFTTSRPPSPVHV